MIKLSNGSRLKKNIRSVKAFALAAALCFCITAGSCSNKTDNNSSGSISSAAESSTVISETADSAASASSKAENSKTESSSKSSKAESGKAASSKSESKAESKAQSSAATKSEGASEESGTKTEQKTDSKTEVKTESAAAAESKDEKTEIKTDGFTKGQTIVVDIRFGGININGAPAKIGAYDYWIDYDTSALEYVKSVEQTKSDLQLVNDKEAGTVKIAHIAAMGFEDDFSGNRKSTYKVYFTAKKDMKDTKEMGLKCSCPSLTAVSMDGKDTFTLINTKTPEDKYSEYVVVGE